MALNIKEPENRHEEYERIQGYDELCLECKEAIFTPICPECLAKAIEVWMSECLKGKKYEKLRREIRDEIKASLKLKFPSTKCIKCKGNVFMCPYCFTERVYKVIKKSKLSKAEKTLIIENFLTFFNFDFDHTGYSKEIL
ncbi:MAG: hypothetical protein QXS07_02590 [Candidatus Pacearchaeota archaeon]